MDCGLPLLEQGWTVSEYQYYEFRAIDRPLDDCGLRALWSLSTRTEITQTSFVNTYDWGDFKGDLDALMESVSMLSSMWQIGERGGSRFACRGDCIGPSSGDEHTICLRV